MVAVVVLQVQQRFSQVIQRRLISVLVLVTPLLVTLERLWVQQSLQPLRPLTAGPPQVIQVRSVTQLEL